MKPASKPYCMTTGQEITPPMPPGIREIRARREELQEKGLTWEQAMMQANAEIYALRDKYFERVKPEMTVEQLKRSLPAFIATHGARRDVPFQQRHWIDTNEPRDAAEDRRRFDDSFNE